MRTRIDPLETLEREDKWFLGGGRGLVFAPPFPRYLDRIGFWDEAHFVDVRLERLFTTLVLDENCRPETLRLDSRRWTPDALTLVHHGADGLRIREDRVVTSNDVLACRLAFRNDGKRARRLNLVLWSLQQSGLRSDGDQANAEEISQSGDYLAYRHTVRYGPLPYSDRPAENRGWGERRPRSAEQAHGLYVALGADRPPHSYEAALAERSDTSPLWEVSIAPERLGAGGFRNLAVPTELAAPQPSHVHLCMHYLVDLPVGEEVIVQFGAAVHLERPSALLHLQNDLQVDVAEASRRSWRRYFASVPYFECDDPYLQRAYWYRWYGIRLNSVSLGGHRVEGEEGIRFEHPCVLEGIDGFRSHISYSAHAHMRETSWMHSPKLAMGCLEGVLAAQENNGVLPGHLYLWRETRGFYHADWGTPVWQLYQITGDREFLARVYPGLCRYAEYFDRDRDREDWRLYDVADQGETGQEYMARYLFADEHADDWRRIRLKGVDATVYIYCLQDVLAKMATELGVPEEADVWSRKAAMTRGAVRERMWDPEDRFFKDVRPADGLRSPSRAAVGFYPFSVDIAGVEHLPAIVEGLLEPTEFWTEHPVPASSLADPLSSAEAEWKGRRMSCPWNGRMWPMATSHVADALARAARMLDPELRPAAAELIRRYVRTLFYDGDHRRPNCFEHYNPLTGVPCHYRGIDDYMHSWVVDLVIRHVVGLQFQGNGNLAVDPLPFGLKRFSIEEIPYRGVRVSVAWSDAAGLSVAVDGVEKARSTVLERLEVAV